MTPPPAITATLLAVLGLSACSKPARVASTPAPDPSLELHAVWDHSPSDAKSRKPRATPDPRAAAEARALAAEWEAETEQVRRIELIYELAQNGTDDAREQLGQLYDTTTDPELKMHAIAALPFLPEGDLALPLRLLADALAPTQPLELRATALEALGELESPAALPLWQELLTDDNADIRALAGAAIDALTPPDAPDAP